MTAPSDDLIRVRFAHFIERSLRAARTRGMTDRAIEQATGIRASTFHRWRRAEVRTTPDLSTVRRFVEGVGADMDDALIALGLTGPGARTNPEPQPQVDPDIAYIQRILNDPNAPAVDKLLIQESVAMLADRVRRGAARKRQEGA